MWVTRFCVLVGNLILVQLVQVSNVITSRDVLDGLGIGPDTGRVFKRNDFRFVFVCDLRHIQDYSPSCGLCHKRRGGPRHYVSGPQSKCDS
nr:MAG TPA: hypothetical protein [Caudoviricetes sp.]